MKGWNMRALSHELGKGALHYIGLFAALSLAFFLSMALVFAIPNDQVRTNVERSDACGI